MSDCNADLVFASVAGEGRSGVPTTADLGALADPEENTLEVSAGVGAPINGPVGEVVRAGVSVGAGVGTVGEDVSRSTKERLCDSRSSSSDPRVRRFAGGGVATDEAV